ncbi:hypothetical protein [Actinomadura harenae]
MGLPDEIEAAIEALRSVLDVIEESKPYANCGNSRAVRVYLEARPGAAPSAPDQGSAELLARAEAAEDRLRQTASAVRGLADRADAAEATADRWRKRAEEAEAAIAGVRRLCDLTISASCRVQAIEQARDTLTVLDRTMPEG